MRLALGLITLAGCVDGFQGSNVQFDFATATPAEAPVGTPPAADELPTNVHFTLYAFQSTTDVGRLFEIQRFEIHHIVDLTSPCFIDVGAHVPHPGLHVSQYAAMIAQDTGYTYAAGQIDLADPPAGVSQQQMIDAATAQQRQDNVAALASDMGIKVVSSASIGVYPAVGADCTDTSGIPPPTCTDADSNKRRLAMCQAAWKADPSYFEGTDRVLTAPLNGTTHGMVDGANPINLAPVGGAQLYVDSELSGFDGFAVYWQYDDADGDGMPDYPPGTPPDQESDAGQLLLFGTPTMPTRGVIHVHMTSAADPMVTAELAIFSNLDDDNTSF